SIAPKAFLTSRIATEAMETPPVTRPLAGAPLSAPAGSFRMRPTSVPQWRVRTPGLPFGGIIGAISIPPSLQMHLIRAGKSRWLAQKPPWHLAPGAAAVKRHRNLARIPIKWSERERTNGNVLMLRPAGPKPVSPHE